MQFTALAAPDLLKKNGSIHWAKCGAFYGVSRPQTAKSWFRLGAPILDPVQMGIWLTNMRAERLRKIAKGNRHYGNAREVTVVARQGFEKVVADFNLPL